MLNDKNKRKFGEKESSRVPAMAREATEKGGTKRELERSKCTNETQDKKINFQKIRNWDQNYNEQNKRNNRQDKVPHYGCYVCGGSHFANMCLQRAHSKNQGTQRNDSERSHRIYAATRKGALETQATPLLPKGTLFGREMTILIDSGATNSFIFTHVLREVTERPTILAKGWKVEFGSSQAHTIDRIFLMLK